MAAFADQAAFWIGWTVITVGGAALFGVILWLLVHRIGVNAMRTARELGAQAHFFRWYRRALRLKARRAGSQAHPSVRAGTTPPKRRKLSAAGRGDGNA